MELKVFIVIFSSYQSELNNWVCVSHKIDSLLQVTHFCSRLLFIFLCICYPFVQKELLLILVTKRSYKCRHEHIVHLKLYWFYKPVWVRKKWGRKCFRNFLCKYPLTLSKVSKFVLNISLTVISYVHLYLIKYVLFVKQEILRKYIWGWKHYILQISAY